MVLVVSSRFTTPGYYFYLLRTRRLSAIDYLMQPARQVDRIVRFQDAPHDPLSKRISALVLCVAECSVAINQHWLFWRSFFSATPKSNPSQQSLQHISSPSKL